MQLLEEIKSLKPNYLILDTSISNFLDHIVLVREDDPNIEGNATDNQKIITGLPSKTSLEKMLQNIGFSYEYYD